MKESNPKAFALVAGGSRGIGFAIAMALAKRGFNLVLIARGTADLEKAKEQIEKGYGVQVETLSFDLSREESALQIMEWMNSRNIGLKMLCNVVGIGGADDFLTASPEQLWYMIRLNTGSCMSLTYRLLPFLEKQAPAYILNVASMAGFAPMPIKNMYSSTKSSVIFFSYALRYQLKEKNISVSCLAPGPVFTRPAIEKETRKRLGSFGNLIAMKPMVVGEIAVNRTLRGRLLIIPGVIAKATALFLRVLPRRLAVALYYQLGKKP